MLFKWQNYKFSELVYILGGGTPKTTISEYWNGTIPWLSVKDFNSGEKFVYTTEKTITQLGLEKSSTRLLKKNDIILSARGTVGEIAVIPFAMAFNQSCYGIRAKEEVINSDFLYYLLKNSIDLLKHNTHGSVFDTITRETFDNIEIKLPPRKTQQKIAQILNAIDDKIELNNRINKNLEQQAQVIFKSWFVDFEPFGGTIPNDWTKKTLDEFCSIFTGRKNANQFEEDGENKFFTCGPNPLKINSYIYDGPAIIISGNGAYTGRTRFYNGKFDLYQRTYACTMLENIDSDYIYLLYIIIKNVLQDKIMGGTHGSAIPYIVMNDIAKFELFYNNEIFNNLSQIMKSIVNEIMHNELENEQLIQLRDTLLPKLMSGEIDVSNVDISTDKLLFNKEE